MDSPKAIGGELKDGWMGVGYIPGNLNTPAGITKATDSASSGGILNENKFRIVTEIQPAESRERLHPPKHYIV